MEPPSTGRVSVINQSGRRMPVTRIKQAAERALGSAPGSVCILLTDDAEVRRLNSTFRGVDEDTDVLSFPAFDVLEAELATNNAVQRQLNNFPTHPVRKLTASLTEEGGWCSGGPDEVENQNSNPDFRISNGLGPLSPGWAANGGVKPPQNKARSSPRTPNGDSSSSPDLPFSSSVGIRGDIAISVPFAQRQAAARGVSLDVELQYLAIHGALHLIGWDDVEDREREQMQAEMNRIGGFVGLPPDPEWGSVLH